MKFSTEKSNARKARFFFFPWKCFRSTPNTAAFVQIPDSFLLYGTQLSLKPQGDAGGKNIKGENLTIDLSYGSHFSLYKSKQLVELASH